MKSDIALHINCHQDFIEEARYVFNTLFTIMGISYREVENTGNSSEANKILINYGNRIPLTLPSEYLIQIKEFPYSEIKNKVAELKPKYLQASKANGKNYHLPTELMYFSGEFKESFDTILYSDREDDIPLVTSGSKELWCGVDFISFIFLLLSLEPENIAEERDSFGRVTKKSLLKWSELFNHPQIDVYSRFFKCLLLRSADEIGLKLNFQDVWPQNHTFALCLSHDVDRIQSWTFAKIKRAVFPVSGKGNYFNMIIKLFQTLRSVFYKSNWSGNIKYITDMEISHNCRSTFFFISNATSPRDPHYRLSSKKIAKSLQRIREAGSHMGLHGSFNSYKNYKILKMEKARLESSIRQKIYGLRQHYLRFGGQESFRAWESAGFTYDSTLGFSDEPGYRCGISYPFYPYSKIASKSYGFLEIPMILMDTVLFLKQNLSLDAAQAWEMVQIFLNKTQQNSGCLTVNWHNNNIHSHDVTGFSQLYEKILDWGNNHNAWICSPDELYEWWKAREKKIWKTP